MPNVPWRPPVRSQHSCASWEQKSTMEHSSNPRGAKRNRGSGSRSPTPVPQDVIDVRCSSCGEDVSNDAYASLVGCVHNLCFVCFGAAQANRSADINLKCPASGCSNKTGEWKIHSIASASRRGGSSDGSSRRRGNVVDQSIKKPKDYGYRNRHPSLYYSAQDDDYKDRFAILSLAVADKQKGNKTKVFTVELRRDGTDEYGDKEISSLEAIGQNLHPCLVSTNKNGNTNTKSVFSGKSVDYLQQMDKSPLRKFVHAIATAEQFHNSNNKSAYHQRENNVSHTAADLIRTAKGGGTRNSPLKSLVTDSMMTSAVPEALVKLFNSIGISRGCKYLNLTKDKAVDELIKQGYVVSGRGYGVWIGVYDNIGFRKRAGYVQFTLLGFIHVDVQDLIKLKIYPDPTREDKDAAIQDTLSRTRLDWNEEKKDYTFYISDEDGRSLAANVVLPYISFVLEAFNKAFPSLEQAKSVRNGTAINFHGTIARSPAARGVFQEEETEEDTPEHEGETTLTEIEVDDTDIEDINDLDPNHVEDPATSLDANNMTFDLPRKEDLAAIKTVKGLVELYTGITKKALQQTTYYDGEKLVHAKLPGTDEESNDEPKIVGNPWLENGWDKHQVPKPFAFGPYICGDGLPTFAMLRLKRTDPNYRNKDFLPFNGGFHTMLEFHKLRGKMFGLSHLREIWQQWRSTKPQLDWVMIPGDPGQVEEEMIAYYYGMVAAAVEGLLEERRAAGGSMQISATDVYNFMKAAAQKSAIAQVIYNELRFAEAMFLLQRAEEEGNAEMFVTGMKFASLLYTVNHATKYSNIAAEFLIWWHCASAAEKAFFEKYILVRKTKKSKTIFTDRFFEWLIRDVRAGVGKHYRRGTDLALERQTALLNAQKRFEESMKDQRQKNDTDKKSTRPIGKVFCYVFSYCVVHQIWGGRDGDTTSRVTIEENSIPINTEMVDAPVIGEEKMNQYMKFKLIDTTGTASAREKEISKLLKAVQPTVEMQRENDKLELERSVSTDVTFVTKHYDASEIKAVHERVRSEWNPYDHGEHILAQLPKPNCKKVFYAEIICDARRKWIERDPSWIQTEQNNIRSMWAYRDNRNNNEIRKRLDNVMTHRFFHLVENNSSLLLQYSSKKYDVTATTNVGDSNNRNTTQRRDSALWRLR